MAILINGFDMPKNCYDCLFVHKDSTLSADDFRFAFCTFPSMGAFVTENIETRREDCPLQSPHGTPARAL